MEALLAKQGRPDSPWLNVVLLFASSGLSFPELLTTQSLLSKASAAISKLKHNILSSSETPEMKAWLLSGLPFASFESMDDDQQQLVSWGTSPERVECDSRGKGCFPGEDGWGFVLLRSRGKKAL
eukprot:3311832-Amphidinium_carterae.1